MLDIAIHKFKVSERLIHRMCFEICSVSVLTSTLGYIHMPSTNQQNILMLFSQTVLLGRMLTR